MRSDAYYLIQVPLTVSATYTADDFYKQKGWNQLWRQTIYSNEVTSIWFRNKWIYTWSRNLQSILEASLLYPTLQHVHDRLRYNFMKTKLVLKCSTSLNYAPYKFKFTEAEKRKQSRRPMGIVQLRLATIDELKKTFKEKNALKIIVWNNWTNKHIAFLFN